MDKYLNMDDRGVRINTVELLGVTNTSAMYQGERDKNVTKNVTNPVMRLSEALTPGRALHDQTGTAFVLCYLGAVANAHNKYIVARQYLEESLVLWRNVGSENNIGLALMFLCDTLLGLGNLHHAQTLFTGSADVLNQVENTSVLPYPLPRLAYVAEQQGNVGRATALDTSRSSPPL